MIEILHFEGKDSNRMECEFAGYKLAATGSDYKRAFENILTYLGDVGANISTELIQVKSDDGSSFMFNAKEDLQVMRETLDACYDMVDEVVASMRHRGWDGLGERTHRLYEALYVDAVETFDAEEVMLNSG